MLNSCVPKQPDSESVRDLVPQELPVALPRLSDIEGKTNLVSRDDRRLLSAAPFTQLQQAPGSMDQRREYLFENSAATVLEVTLYI